MKACHSRISTSEGRLWVASHESKICSGEGQLLIVCCGVRAKAGLASTKERNNQSCGRRGETKSHYEGDGGALLERERGRERASD